MTVCNLSLAGAPECIAFDLFMYCVLLQAVPEPGVMRDWCFIKLSPTEFEALC
jgi:hypothetical protein